MYSLRYLLISAFTLYAISASSQTDREKYEAFKKQVSKEYNDFRDKANKEYADFIKQTWESFNASEPILQPKEKPVPPVVKPEEDHDKVTEDIPLPIKEVIVPTAPKPQPLPPAPIKEQPLPVEQLFSFSFFGTEAKVRLDDNMRFQVDGVEEKSVSRSWTSLSENKKYDNLIRDCLELRIRFTLSDWAYLCMLQSLAETFCGEKTNEAVLLMAYLYCQSGYQMRLGQDNGHLYLLYASHHDIYNISYYQIDGTKFYPLGYDGVALRICKAVFPKEQPLSLYITTEQQLASRPSEGRILRSKRYPDMEVEVKVNKNRLDFFSSYPSSKLGENVMTCWAMYAETPMESQMKETLYPSLEKHLNGLSKREAAEKLLNWVQTAFTYDYDNNVWGGERVFFAEETLFYPFCDCEDRSILLTRLYRDLLGLKCLLVYYPGHLATAVHLQGEQSGDYIELNGERYIVADPTYIGASIGDTMPGMNNKEASVILLN